MKCGRKKFKKPLQRPWPYFGSPRHVEIFAFGRLRRFVPAKTMVRYKNVVAQYREDVEFDSLHLKVLKNGWFVIDHRDCVNPDKGRLHKVGHVMEDTWVGDVVKVTAGTAAGIAVLVGIASLFK